jgi:segregation and condensation protein A
VRRLVEYEQMKLAAARLDALPLVGRDVFRAAVEAPKASALPLTTVDLEDLRSAWTDLIRRAKLVQTHRIAREHLSVREHMSRLLRGLQGKRFAVFEDLFEPERGVAVLVVTFIALLELAREQLVELTQAEAGAPLYVRMTVTLSS